MKLERLSYNLEQTKDIRRPCTTSEITQEHKKEEGRTHTNKEEGNQKEEASQDLEQMTWISNGYWRRLGGEEKGLEVKGMKWKEEGKGWRREEEEV